MRIKAVLSIVILSMVSIDVLSGPDTVLHNGQILTVDPNFSIRQAIAIKAGEIIAVGDDQEVLSLVDKDTRIEDLQGKTVIPGLIDNHIHMIRAAQQWHGQVRLDAVLSYQNALNLIAEKAKQLDPGQWILVQGGFIERQFEDKKGGFELADLDRAAPENPVYIQHLFDWGYANSLALAAAGVDSKAPKEKIKGLLLDDNGLPQGAVTMLMQQRVVDSIPTLSADHRLEAARRMVADLNKVGLTSVLDVGGFDMSDAYYQPFKQLEQQQQLDIRLNYLVQLIPWELGWGQDPQMQRLDPFTLPERTGRMRAIGVGEQVYLPVQDSAGRPAKSSAEVRSAFSGYLRQLAEKGVHVHLHAVNDRSINQHLDMLEKISAEIDLKPLRWTFAHADGIRPETIKRVKSSGLNIAIHSRPVLIGYRFHSRFGKAAYQMTPMKDLVAAGLPFGLGSDSPMVSIYNPFVTLWWAVNGKMIDGTVVSEQTIDRKQALIAHTINNARLVFAEQQLGSLEAGKRADLVILDQDYMTVPQEQIKKIRPVATMVEGRWVYRK